MDTAVSITLAEAIGRKTRSLTPEELSALDRADCGKCGRPASESPNGLNGVICDQQGRITGVECVPCWNASVEEYRQQRKAELAARPRCEACQRRVATWTMHGTDAPASVCGTCKNAVNRRIRSPMLFGPPSATRAQILAAARSKP
jgi:hypothetical protein